MDLNKTTDVIETLAHCHVGHLFIECILPYNPQTYKKDRHLYGVYHKPHRLLSDIRRSALNGV